LSRAEWRQIGKKSVNQHDRVKRSNEDRLAWLLKSFALSGREKMHWVAMSLLVELWLFLLLAYGGEYQLISIEKACSGFLR
jgi:hypothetical protein